MSNIRIERLALELPESSLARGGGNLDCIQYGGCYRIRVFRLISSSLAENACSARSNKRDGVQTGNA